MPKSPGRWPISATIPFGNGLLNQYYRKNHFSADSVNDQLKKIISDPVFSVSDILKKFLSFIVQQTLAGHSNQLKEYTIGVYVLGKRADFRPQTDAILRIHATRQRRALNHYYDNTGKEDLLRIIIPKGNYMPYCCKSGSPVRPENTRFEEKEYQSIKKNSPVALVVLPF